MLALGCYKYVTGLQKNWTDAKQFCEDDIHLVNHFNPDAITHLVSLETSREKAAMIYWMRAFNLKDEFWTDGMVPSSVWSWSNGPIDAVFSSSEQLFYGNGTNLKIIYDTRSTTYYLADDVKSQPKSFICEYQVRCNGSGVCQNGGECFENFDEEICLCQPGYTGTFCEIEIDECLSSPCQHGGICKDEIDGFLCDCSKISFEGNICEIEKINPDQSIRKAAFWSLIAVVTTILVLLTLSDLPWHKILNRFSCFTKFAKCCSPIDYQEKIGPKNIQAAETNDSLAYQGVKTVSIGHGFNAKTINCHVIETVWRPPTVQSKTPESYKSVNGRSPLTVVTPIDDIGPDPIATGLIDSNESTINEKQNHKTNPNNTQAIDLDKSSTDPAFDWTKKVRADLRSGQQ